MARFQCPSCSNSTLYEDKYGGLTCDHCDNTWINTTPPPKEIMMKFKPLSETDIITVMDP